MAGTGSAHLRSPDDAILRVEDLVVEFPLPGGQTVRAVSGISFDLIEGETLGLVGESGCGKSTTGRAILQLRPPTSGSVKFEGTELCELGHRDLRRIRTRLQMVFQDPISSLNPRRKVKDIVAEGFDIWGRPDDAAERIDEALTAVGLDPTVVGDRRPHEFSGGQCQRISIARALLMRPRILVCDEPVSALDVSVQAQILNLLEEMKARFGLTMVFIAHDLSVVNSISDRVLVMYLGKVCEVGAPGALFERPYHPYTELLIRSIPLPDPHIPRTPSAVQGEMPSPIDPPSGCRFRTRCPHATDVCTTTEPQLVEVSPGRHVACHHPLS
ncbi:MAG: ATP-binding cassette domain-containing protein [Acidimicrobiales bacterium]